MCGATHCMQLGPVWSGYNIICVGCTDGAAPEARVRVVEGKAQVDKMGLRVAVQVRPDKETYVLCTLWQTCAGVSVLPTSGKTGTFVLCMLSATCYGSVCLLVVTYLCL